MSKQQQEEHDPLKQSDLEYFITHFGEYWEKYGMTTMIVILAFLVGVMGMRWWSTKDYLAKELAYAELAESDSPQIIQDVADRHDHIENFAGYALLKAADNAYQAAIGVQPNQSPTGMAAQVGDEEQKRKLREAADLYKRVIDLKQSTLQVINARFGLAAVHETMGDFNAALDEYGKIQNAAGGAYPNLADEAGELATNINQIKQPVEFPPPAEPKLGDLPIPGHGLPQPEGPAVPDLLQPRPQPAPQPKPDTQPAPAPAPQPESDGDGGN